MSLYGMSHDYLISYMISIPWLGQTWASPTIVDSISVYGHSILHSNSKLHENLWYMQTSAHTLSHRPMPPSLSLTLSTWILAARIPLRRKGEVSLMTKRNTESIEIEKWLKKEIAGDFLRAGEEMLFINSKVSWSPNQHIQSISVAFESGIYNASTGFTIISTQPRPSTHTTCSWYRQDYQVHPQVNFCRRSCLHWPLLPY